MIRLLPDRALSARVWQLAGPVVVGMISQTLLNIVDTAMVGRLGPTALAATGLGGVLAWTIMGAIGQLNLGAQAVASRRFGEGKLHAAGRVLDNSLMIALAVGLFTSLVMSHVMAWIYPFFSDDPAVTEVGRGYIRLRLYGSLPFMVIMAHRGFFNGIGETRLHMRVAIAINVFNALLNWVFIFGNLGAPSMGAAGAGLASTLATTAGMLLFIGIGIAHRERGEYGYYRVANLGRETLWGVTRLTIPSGMHALLVMAGFSAFSAICARLGTREMAATNVLLTILSMAYLPGFGFGTAAGTLIGQKLGEGKPDDAEEYGWEAARLGVLAMGAAGVLFIGFPELLMRLFTADQVVIDAGVAPLRMMGFVQVFDAVGMVLSGALEGAGLNRWVMFAELAVNWLFFIPVTYLMALVLHTGLLGAWAALGMYLVLFASVVALKYANGGWKTVKV
jgi:putative MATE family efflux protein